MVTLRSWLVLAGLVALSIVQGCAGGPTPGPTDDLPKVTSTTSGVAMVLAGAGNGAPKALVTGATEEYDVIGDELDDLFDHLREPETVPAPSWLGDATPAAVWWTSCTYGLVDVGVADGALQDGWDGSSVGFDGDPASFGTGTFRTFDDGTAIHSCASTSTLGGLSFVRHLVIPGAGTDGRFLLDVTLVTNETEGPIDLAQFGYNLDDGAEDELDGDWEDYGAIGAFEWATKDANDLFDPAIGVLPLLPATFDVNREYTGGEYYVIFGTGTLPAGATTGYALLTGVRGGFVAEDASGKAAAMQALGAELDAVDLNDLCQATPDGAFVWTRLIDGGDTLAEEICARFEAR